MDSLNFNEMAQTYFEGAKVPPYYKTLFKNEIPTSFKTLTLKEIKPATCLPFIKQKSSQYKSKETLKLIENVLDYFILINQIDTSSPINFKKINRFLKLKDQTVNHPCLDYKKAPEFYKEMDGSFQLNKKALCFLMLTLCRASEVLNAQWNEIDLKKKVWVIPAERMKTKNKHTVPLTKWMIKILNSIAQKGDYIFSKTQKPYSHNTFYVLLKPYGITAHGFRSTFYQWTIEESFLKWEVREKMLSHSIGTKVERSYERNNEWMKLKTDGFNKWNKFLTG